MGLSVIYTAEADLWVVPSCSASFQRSEIAMFLSQGSGVVFKPRRRQQLQNEAVSHVHNMEVSFASLTSALITVECTVLVALLI